MGEEKGRKENMDAQEKRTIIILSIIFLIAVYAAGLYYLPQHMPASPYTISLQASPTPTSAATLTLYGGSDIEIDFEPGDLIFHTDAGTVLTITADGEFVIPEDIKKNPKNFENEFLKVIESLRLKP